MQRQLEARLPEVRGLACLPISGLTGEGTQQLLPAAVELYQAWARRVPTARLNRWLVAVRTAVQLRAILAGLLWTDTGP